MIMRKITALCLILIMLLSTLLFSACSGQGISNELIDSSTSSASAEVSAFLTDYAKEYYGIELKAKDNRVSYRNRSIIIGTADEAIEYGVNVSSITEGGYMLRYDGHKGVIFAPDAAGLDKGVRYFARNCMNENGFNTREIIKVESGYRIKRLTVAGNDISLYTIKIPMDADGDIKLASTELQTYIAQACGAELSISDDTSSQYLIELKKDTSKDGELGKESFLIKTDSKKITIEGGYKRGCTYGVFELLEKYIGWRFVRSDTYYLYESEHVDIPSGINDFQKPGFEY